MPTQCYLTVLKVLTTSQITQLAPMLELMGPGDPDVSEALSENAQIDFGSIFEGDMPTAVLRWFSNNKIPFTWEWAAYDDIGAAIQYYEPVQDIVHLIRMHEGLAVISVTEAIDFSKVSSLSKIIIDINTKRHEVGLV